MSTHYIRNALNSPGTLLALIRNVNRQRHFIQQELHPILKAAAATNDGTLEESDFSKITGYYGLAVPAILGEALCTWRGRKMTQQERLALTYQGAMTGLFDDFFDKYGNTNESVRALMERPQQLSGSNSAERLFLDFYRKAVQYAADPSLLLHYLGKVYDAQIESKRQALPGLSGQELLDITIEKGGVSVLFYRAVLAHPFRAGEETALHAMGGLMQLGNDIFDVFKDRNKGIHTPMTTARKVQDIRDVFANQKQASYSAVKATGYPRRQTNQFLRQVSLGLCSRCLVFFDQLERKQRTTNDIFTPHLYTREDLVCDMEKASNKWKTINYFIRSATE